MQKSKHDSATTQSGTFSLAKDLAALGGGVVLLLTVAGFLVLRSHAAALGLSNVLHHAITDYSEEGGAFFLTTILWAVPAIAFSSPTFWVGVCALGSNFYLRANPLLTHNLLAYLPMKRKLNNFPASMIVCSAAFLLAIYAIVHLLPSPTATDLLFATGDKREIALRATAQGTRQLEADYLDGVRDVFLSGILIFFGWRALGARPRILTTPGRVLLGLLMLVQALLLPVLYGKNIYSNSFHSVARLVLVKEVEDKVPRSSQIWLLNRSTDHLVFYFGDSYTVSLIKKDSVLEVSLGERRNIFAP